MWDWVLKTSEKVMELFDNFTFRMYFFPILGGIILWCIIYALFTNCELVEVGGVWYGLRGRCDKDGKGAE